MLGVLCGCMSGMCRHPRADEQHGFVSSCSVLLYPLCLRVKQWLAPGRYISLTQHNVFPHARSLLARWAQGDDVHHIQRRVVHGRRSRASSPEGCHPADQRSGLCQVCLGYGPRRKFNLDFKYGWAIDQGEILLWFPLATLMCCGRYHLIHVPCM